MVGRRLRRHGSRGRLARQKDDWRLGAADDEGGRLGWCALAAPLPAETNGDAVDAVELELASTRRDGESKKERVVVIQPVRVDDAAKARVFLLPGRSYVVRSRARNRAGWSPWADIPKTFDTPPGLPPPPLAVVERKTDRLRLRMERPAAVDLHRAFRRGRHLAADAADYFAAETDDDHARPAEPDGAYEVAFRDCAKVRAASDADDVSRPSGNGPRRCSLLRGDVTTVPAPQEP